ncbi:hypothetical protein DM02DRAFT_620020 [Periconia macrospinosa]|uniref:Uncharacterized protein n=1 Tax=Periconia macrospinosa TaxID=97972 RepID=A0A2V1D4Z9_9PLEO|nr:hypothetical protein DM02DRAFT_620020 [Periconia macrospinosa]
MQLTLALVAALFSTAISAAPAVAARNGAPTLRFQVSNDRTGRFATGYTATDGIARNLIDIFKGSPIDENGTIYGTSVMLTGGFNDNTRCFFQNGNTVINFNGRQTFADLDGDNTKATPIALNGFNIQCS